MQRPNERPIERPWLRNYPPGVPAEIDPSQYTSLVALFEESFAANRGKPAFACMDKTITYGEVDAASRAFAAWLQHRGLKRGDRVAVMMPNVLQYPITVCAILRAGFTVVNVNPLYKPRELEIQLNDSDASTIIVLENFAHVLEEALPQTPHVRHVVVASLGDMLGMIKGAAVNLFVRRVKKLVPKYNLPDITTFRDALDAGRGHRFHRADVKPDDIAFLQYTGGTTGIAKGAMLLHHNLVANVLQVAAWHAPMIAMPPPVATPVIITALPLYHIFGLTGCLFFGIYSGGLCVFIPNPRDLNALVKDLMKVRATMFPAVNTLYNALLHHRDFSKIDWSMLKSAIGGGMAVQKVVADAWMKATGKPIIEGYGLSETSPVLTCNRGDITEWTGTIGYPMPSTDVVIRDDDNNDMPLGERGEICARGPQVMAGYWQRPDETARVMTPDGFFRTGDIGTMDALGRITIVDRKKDMISVSGFKVFPNEVEDVCMMQGGVLECAAIGVPDQHSGEAVKLFAVKKRPELNEAELRKFMSTELAGYKVPKYIEFRDDLPKTNVGKILRRALRDGA